MSENKKIITKKDWVSNFTLIGKPVINDNTFKIEERKEGSNWIYNSLFLGVDCGEKYGVVHAEMMGGYDCEKNNVIYAFGKDENDSTDFDTKLEVAWEDRFDEDILDSVGELSFITVGLEKTDKDKTYYKNFLSAYDAIAYIKEHLNGDMVVNVKGKLKYTMYQDTVQVRKNITSIVLSKVDDSSKYISKFTQTILIDKDSASLKNIDKDKGVMYVDAKVLDYLKDYNGIEVKGQYPYNKQFEYQMDFSNEDLCKKIVTKLFKVKKNYTQITFDGELIESGATVAVTLDDVPDEIKELIGVVFTEEEALEKCSSNGNKEYRMLLRKPTVKLEGEDKIPVLQKFEERYTEDDLYLDYLYKNKNETDDSEDVDDANETESLDSLDWLDKL